MDTDADTAAMEMATTVSIFRISHYYWAAIFARDI